MVPGESYADPPRLSLVVPVFNERENLETLVEELTREMRRIESPYELILVDDGSGDGSGEILDGLARDCSAVRVLHLERNQGQSAALLAGLAAARGEYCITLDADLQNDPADIARLLEWIPRYDLVVGIRRRRRDSWFRRVQSRVANRVRSRILGDGVADTGCSLKVFRRDLAAGLPRFNGVHRFLPFLAGLQGASVTQVPVNHRPRTRGESKYNARNRLGRGILDLAAMWWLKRRYLRVRVAYESVASGRKTRRAPTEES